MAILKDGGVKHAPQAEIIPLQTECWHADAYRRYCVAMLTYAGELSVASDEQMTDAREAAEWVFDGAMESPAGSAWAVLFKLKMQALNWNSATFAEISCREAGDTLSRLSAELEAALTAGKAVRS